MSADQATGLTPRAAADEAALAAFLRSLPQFGGGGAPGTPLPELDAARQVGADAELVERFTRAATATGIRVVRAGATEWISAVQDILRSCGAKNAYAATATLAGLSPNRSTAALSCAESNRSTAALGCAESNPAGGGRATSEGAANELVAALRAGGCDVKLAADDETLFNVDAGITGATCGIAETGTIVCTSGPGAARGASLIPPVHIAVLTAGQLVPDLLDYLMQFGAAEAWPANANLISGPSKTADIEGVLVTGVHGPGRVYVVLVG